MRLTTTIKSLQLLDYKLLLAIMLTLLVPTLYATFRIYFISDIPNEWGFNIASQIAWLNIIYEILQEAIILPLFYFLGTAAWNRCLFTNCFIYGLKIVTPIYILLTLSMWIALPYLVPALNQQQDLISDTITYIRLETIIIPLRLFIDMVFVSLLILNRKRDIYLMMFCQIIVRFVCDYILISSDVLNLGVIGIAYSSILINIILSVISLILLLMFCNFAEYKKPFEANWKIHWFKICFYSGMESGVRNIAFIIMVLKLVNELKQPHIFWLTNNFIWGWLLLPILAIGSLIKRDVAINKGIIQKRFNAYLTLTTICIVVWLITIPLWSSFIKNIMGINDPNPIVNLSLTLIAFYIIFAFNNVFDSYFYGMGKTNLMLIQSMAVNILYYGSAFILYLNNIFIPSSLYSIALLFGFGIILDFILTLYLFKKQRYPIKI